MCWNIIKQSKCWFILNQYREGNHLFERISFTFNTHLNKKNKIENENCTELPKTEPHMWCCRHGRRKSPLFVPHLLQTIVFPCLWLIGIVITSIRWERVYTFYVRPWRYMQSRINRDFFLNHFVKYLFIQT